MCPPLLANLPTDTKLQLHSVVSNRMLNVLIKARKNGYVQFKGELLLQGKDDDEIITLIKLPTHYVQITKTKTIAKRQ